MTEAGPGTRLLGTSHRRYHTARTRLAAAAAAGAPPPRLPSPCPSEPVPQKPPFEGGRSPSYLCPRSGRLLVPRPQSPFDPCSAPSHVTRWAGRALRRPAQPDSAAGVSPPFPLFLPASHPGQGSPQVLGPAGGPRMARRRGRDPQPAGRLCPRERGGGRSVCTRGPEFQPLSNCSQRKGLHGAPPSPCKCRPAKPRGQVLRCGSCVEESVSLSQGASLNLQEGG